MIELGTIKNFRMLPPVLAPRLPARVVWCVSAFAIFSGWVTLLGWMFEVRRWTDWWDDGISMFVNTALCSIFCGLALILTTFAPSVWRVTAIRSLGVLVTAIGGLTIFEHATGLNLGVDTILIERSWGQDAAMASMRMGPPAATSFLLLGIAIVLTASSPTGRRNATALAILPIAIALLSIIGYLFGAGLLFGIAKLTGIARQTSIVIAALGVGVIAAVPEYGLMAALRRNDPGGVMLRHLLVPILVVPILLGWARVAGQEAGYYDTAFGTAMLILFEVAFLFALLWWTTKSIGIQAKAAQDAALRLAAIVESTSDAVVGKKLDGTIQSWNEGAVELFGYTAPEAIGKNVGMLIPSDRLTEEEIIQERLGRGERVDPYETIRLRRDGSKVHVSLTVSPIRDAAGNIVGASKIARDITPRIKADEAIRRSESELRALANTIPQLAWMATPDGYIFWFNQGWYDFTGTTFDDMAGWGWQSVHDPEMLPSVLQGWSRSLQTGEPFEMEFPLRGANGEFRWFLTRVRPLRDEQDNVLRWFGTSTDVDAGKQEAQALQQKSHTLELLNEAGKTLGGKLELNELLQAVTDVATELSNAQFGAFFYTTTDESGDSFQLFTLSGADRQLFEKLGMPRATPLFAPTFAGDEIVRSDDIVADRRYGQNAPHYGIPADHLPVRSYLAVPVKSRLGEVIGGLFFGHPEPGRFTEATERVIEGIAGQAGIAIDNARLYENLKQAAVEREQLLEAERHARSEAERLNVMKDEFLATLSHELRTPLNAILGWSQILNMGMASTEDLREGLETIERNARAQTQLIEDLLDMSRIISGKVRLDVQPVNVPDVLMQAVESVRPTAEAKQIALTCHLKDDSGKIAGDGVRLQQVFWNLLSNAIKFTPRGGSVKVAVERIEPNLTIAVQDSGIGIPPDVLTFVFERFRQADSSTTRNFGGLGLGLSIVKNLVEMHGGTVEAESSGAGQGATFTVTLPLLPDRRNRQPEAGSGNLAAQDDIQPDELAGVRILLVDDELDARQLVERVLKQFEGVVATVANADEGLSRLREMELDVIVSDIGMPGIDGYEFMRRVRRLPPSDGGDLPAVALTAFARAEDRNRAIDAGYQVHVAKPIQPRELVATISKLLDGSK